MYYDFHTHLNHHDLYPSWQIFLDRFVQVGGRGLCLIGVDDEYNQKGIEICIQAKSEYTTCQTYCTIGYHPDTVISSSIDMSQVDRMIQNLKHTYQQHPDFIVGIGECGIDTHYPGSSDSLVAQKKLFGLQCDLAQELHLPIVIHSRDDRQSTRDIVCAYPQVMFYRHCWGYDVEQLKMIEQRFTHYMIGYTGIVTFVKAQQIRSCLAITGINHIALETDAPYLAPVPHRGKPNEPSYITYIYQTIAQELNLSLPDLQHRIQNNFTSLYHPVIPK